MTTKITVATASGKMRVAFCKFCSEINSGEWKRGFTTCGHLRRNEHAFSTLEIVVLPTVLEILQVKEQ